MQKIYKNQIVSLTLIAFLIVGCKTTSGIKNDTQIPISDQLKWSERLALTLMKVHPEAYQIDEKTEPKWDYVHGLVLTSFEKLYKKRMTKNTLIT